MLLKKKIFNPTVEISDVLEEVRSVAFPMLFDSDTRIRKTEPVKHGVYVLQFPKESRDEVFDRETQKGEYFTPDYAHRRYGFRIGSSATYIAKGTLNLPDFAKMPIEFTFGKPVHHDQSKSHWWLLQLKDQDKEFNGRYPTTVLWDYVMSDNVVVVKDKDTRQLAQEISSKFENFFLGPQDKKKRIDDLIGQGYDKARELYGKEFEDQLKQGSKNIEPGVYVFRISGDTLLDQ